MLLAVLVIIGKYTDLKEKKKKNNVCFVFVLFFVFFVLFVRIRMMAIGTVRFVFFF